LIKDSSTHFDCLISGVFNHAAEPGRAIRATASISLGHQLWRMLRITSQQSEATVLL